MLGNKQLISYGIEQWKETCDLMFHVSVVTKRVYRYEPKNAWEVIRSGNFPQRNVRTGEVITAQGWLVPPYAIQGCVGIVIPIPIFHDAYFHKMDGTSIKGKKAERIVREMILKGYLSLVIGVVEANNKELQLDTVDLIPLIALNPQVKCDWNAGPRELGGTGNLFIQEKECNLLKLH